MMTHDELVRFAAEKVRVSDDELAALIKCKGHMQTLEIDLAWDLQAARDAYLALREEHKNNVAMGQNIVNKLQKTCEEADREIEQLQAENQAMIPYVELVDKLEAENRALGEKADQLNSDMRCYKSVAENQTGLKLKLEAENQALRRDLMHAIDGIDECWDETYRHGGEETFTEMLCKKYGWDRSELRS